MTPRRLGSPASVAISGCAFVNPSAFFRTSATEPNNNPLRAKKSPLSGWPTSGNRVESSARRRASAALASSALSAVGAFTTTEMPFCGKARDISNWR